MSACHRCHFDPCGCVDVAWTCWICGRHGQAKPTATHRGCAEAARYTIATLEEAARRDKRKILDLTGALEFYANRANHMDARGPTGESDVYQDCGAIARDALDICEDCGADLTMDRHQEDCPRREIDTGSNAEDT